ncbi:MAG: lysophospholipase [Gammaproteobacteria bacterium]|nr:lysophospholipase [Gammaproteobacteria bacterium]MDH5729493.1 lysophospholipase [Gammaproteobacteria bacterium]
MIEAEVSINTGSANLFATFTQPQETSAAPAVLMVHGSGALDRDENSKGFKLNIFNAIAKQLESIGVASLRYDKRGCGKSSGDYYSANHTDLVDDADAWIRFLQQQPSINPRQIFVLGHSEGTLIAPQLSSRHQDIAGIVLLNPFCENLENILLTQAKHIQQSIQTLSGAKGMMLRTLGYLVNPIAFQQRLIRRIKTSHKPVIRLFFFAKIPANWFRQAMQANPSDIHAKTACPVLMIAGGKDIQCSSDDVKKIEAQLQQESETHILTNLTHILRNDAKPASFFNYKKLMQQPVEDEVLQLISQWLQRQIKHYD